MSIDILKRILKLLRDENLMEKDLGEKEVKKLHSSLEGSPFEKSEGKKLALNIVYLICPSRCRLIELSDFVGGCITDGLEKIGELATDNFQIEKIESNADLDWEAFGDEPEEFEHFEVVALAQIDGKSLRFSYPIEKADDPMEAVTAIASVLKDRYPELISNLLITLTVEYLWDEIGAVLICNLPERITLKINDIIAS